jgi:hypothetical protein
METVEHELIYCRLYAAMQRGDYDVVEELLKQGADVNHQYTMVRRVIQCSLECVKASDIPCYDIVKSPRTSKIENRFGFHSTIKFTLLHLTTCMTSVKKLDSYETSLELMRITNRMAFDFCVDAIRSTLACDPVSMLSLLMKYGANILPMEVETLLLDKPMKMVDIVTSCKKTHSPLLAWLQQNQIPLSIGQNQTSFITLENLAEILLDIDLFDYLSDNNLFSEYVELLKKKGTDYRDVLYNWAHCSIPTKIVTALLEGGLEMSCEDYHDILVRCCIQYGNNINADDAAKMLVVLLKYSDRIETPMEPHRDLFDCCLPTLTFHNVCKDSCCMCYQVCSRFEYRTIWSCFSRVVYFLEEIGMMEQHHKNFICMEIKNHFNGICPINEHEAHEILNMYHYFNDHKKEGSPNSSENLLNNIVQKTRKRIERGPSDSQSSDKSMETSVGIEHARTLESFITRMLDPRSDVSVGDIVTGLSPMRKQSAIITMMIRNIPGSPLHHLPIELMLYIFRLLFF